MLCMSDVAYISQSGTNNLGRVVGYPAVLDRCSIFFICVAPSLLQLVLLLEIKQQTGQKEQQPLLYT